MARRSQKPRTSSRTPEPGTLPFSGLDTRMVVIGGALLGVPLLLMALGAMGGQLAALLFGTGLIVICAVAAAWPALDGMTSKLGIAAAIAVAAGTAAVSGLALYHSLYPGDPAAKASLGRTGEEQSLKGLEAGGSFDVVVHAEVGVPVGQEVHAAYELRITSGTNKQDVSGRFDSVRGRSRVGRRTVATVKPPPEWDHHPVRLPPGPQRIRLLRREGRIGATVEVKLYRQSVVWPYLLFCAALLLAATALASRLTEAIARHYLTGALSIASITGLLGSYWTWFGDPLYPLLGATFAALLGGWLLGKILAAAAARLPWAGTSS